MMKILAMNAIAVLFLASCSHSDHSSHAHHENAKKPCKVGQACDSEKKDDCCKDKTAEKKACCIEKENKKEACCADMKDKKEDCCDVKKAS